MGKGGEKVGKSSMEFWKYNCIFGIVFENLFDIDGEFGREMVICGEFLNLWKAMRNDLKSCIILYK